MQADTEISEKRESKCDSPYRANALRYTLIESSGRGAWNPLVVQSPRGDCAAARPMDMTFGPFLPKLHVRTESVASAVDGTSFREVHG